MRHWNPGRYALASCAAAALLAGCAGAQPPIVANQARPIMQARAHHRTFQFTGTEQMFTIPYGVTAIDVDASGAAGLSVKLGRGGRVVATVPVKQREILYVFVGGQGSYYTGGFNGGGSGGTYPYCGHCSYGGGGASDLREGGDGLSQRIVVAGGGGGEGYKKRGGGLGGNLVGGMGQGTPPSGQGPGGQGGGGGTQSEGGAGGAGGHSFGNAGSAGTVGVGGTGGSGYDRKPGGGGGGGFYGGGGGGSGSHGNGNIQGGSGGGGGGGSSYAEPNATNVQMWQGWQNATGNGVIILSW